MRIVKTLLVQAREYKTPPLLAPLCAALEVFFDISVPSVISELIDQGIQAGNLAIVMKYDLFMLLLAICGLAIGFLAGRFVAQASAGFAASLREGMYNNVQAFASSNIDEYSTVGLVTRMTTDMANVQSAYQMIIRVVVRAPLTIIFSMFMRFVVDRQLGLIFPLATIILAASLLFITRKTMFTFSCVFHKCDGSNVSVQENISGIRVAKIFVREEHESAKFTKATENIYRLFVKAEKIVILNNPITMFVIFVCMACLSWFGVRPTVASSSTTGELISLLSYISTMMISLMVLSMIMITTSISMVSVERTSEVLSEKADIVNPENPLMKVSSGSTILDHVYPFYRHGGSEEVLSDINLSIKSGEVIGVIGGTGSGKTSLANLISRPYDIDSGSIKIGRRDVRKYDSGVLHGQVAVVLQKNVLFSGTTLDNFHWGDENATDRECMRACRQACADEFIRRSPNKYSTWVEQGGNNVLDGQKQCLCITRTLLEKPKVLISDDSTGAINTVADTSVRQSSAEMIPGTTEIIIAQHILSVQHANKILVLDGGKILGFAGHDELLKINAIYRGINDVQQQGGGGFDAEGDNN